MPMGRIDDRLHAKKKIAHLLSLEGGAEALGLWVIANSWCNDELTDGHIELFVITRLGPWSERHAELLVTAKLWSKTQAGYQFHDWSDFNELRADVLTKRARDAERKGPTKSAKRARRAADRLDSKEKSDSTRNPRGIHAESEATPGGVQTDSGAPFPFPFPLPLASQEITRDAGLASVPDNDTAPRELVVDIQGAEFAIAGAARDEKFATPSLPNHQLRQAAERFAKVARDRGESREQVARAIAREAIRQAKESGKHGQVGFLMLSVDPWVSRPVQAPSRGARASPARAPGTTAADFEDAEDIEVQMARWKS